MSDAPVLAGVNHVVDLDAAGDFEKKHTPKIDAARTGDKVTVTVAVGAWFAHPNQADHFIQWVELQANGACIARADLAAVAVDPAVTFVVDVEAGTELAALESCNLHGVWKAVVTAP
jgi:superoxide reductase